MMLSAANEEQFVQALGSVAVATAPHTCMKNERNEKPTLGYELANANSVEIEERLFPSLRKDQLCVHHHLLAHAV